MTTTLRAGDIHRGVFQLFREPLNRQRMDLIHQVQRGFDLQIHDWREIIRMSLLWNEAKR